MASTRLRKTFRYPSDDEGSSGSRDDMDEEEQEELITSLQSQSQTYNKLYTIFFTVLPLAISPIFLYPLLLGSTTPARLRLLCLLAATSLLASSFTMFFMSSLSATDARERLDRRQRQMAWRHHQQSPSNTSSNVLIDYATKVMDKLDDIRMDLDVEGPLMQALPWLNATMGGLLLLAAWILKGQTIRGVSDFMWLYLCLPGIMTGVTWMVRRSIMDEEKEIRELRGLKYGYKGA